MILVFIELPVFSESSAHWTTLCGFAGLYSSSAVGLDLGTGSRADRASRAQKQTYTTQEQSVKAPTRGQQKRGGWKWKWGWQDRSRGKRMAAVEDGGFLENP